MDQEWIYIENLDPGQTKAVLAILPPQESPEKAPGAAIVGTFALQDASEGDPVSHKNLLLNSEIWKSSMN